MEYLEALKKRRSIRNLNNQISITEEELIELIKFNLKHAPSSYNSQSPKVLLLLGEKHKEFWDITLDKIKEIVNEEQFKQSKKKLLGFKNGYGTILFFDDLSITENLKEKYPLYKEKTQVYSEHNNAILQANIWTSLAEKNIGASLQHYNELVNDSLEEAFGVPKICRLIAQMPFGGIIDEPKPKQFLNTDDRIIVLK